MTKEIQRLKKQLLREELRRQGKVPSYRRWLLAGVFFALVIAGSLLWYQANLQKIVGKRLQTALEFKATGRYAEALDALQRLYKDYPKFATTPQALIESGEILELYLGRYDDALLTYLLLLRDFPDHPSAPAIERRIADLYKFRLDNCSQAIAVYQRIVDRSEGDGDRLQYEVADCYFQLNNFEQARIEFESLQKKYPQSDQLAEVQFRIAVTYALEGQLPEAEASYRMVVQNWPENPYALEARFGLAGVLEEQERLLEAREELVSLQGIYRNQSTLNQKLEQIQARIDKKKKAI
ncbi:MAG: hypothetical protein C0614_02590 [Desulfuromonas sp.]|nr:MAG: hypothetical protein C0614_02590 [Desulfuromonas sp.]